MPNISSIGMVACTNSELPYINSVTLLAKDGREVVLDRSTTEFDFDDDVEILSMFWLDLYIWTGEAEDHNVPEELFDGAVVINVDIEDDAPEDYFFELKEFHAAGRSIPVCIGPKEKYLRNKELMERIVKYCTLRDMFDDICFYTNGHKYSSDYHQSAIPITIPITSDDVCLVRFDEPSEAPVEATYYDCGECDVRQIVKFCNPDTVTMTFEGEFNSAYNGYYGNNVTEEDITSIANDYGLYPEQGYAWSLAFYEV